MTDHDTKPQPQDDVPTGLNDRDEYATQAPQGEQPALVGGLPEKFGRYKVLKTLGKGGMGAVYLALDSQLDRRVAIKVPFVGLADSSDVLDRFQREAKSLAAIVHPNICPIHEVGVVDGIHFLSMTYVEGKPLTDYVRPENPLPIKQAVLLVRKLALALHNAHAAGVIHRDLKPSNIIINNLREPIIMDFGLARRAGTPDEVLTQAGQMMGTPAYMPPEQVAGNVEAMGPCCDIYSLGVICYELLTGSRPFTGDFLQLITQIAQQDPDPPSTRRPEIPARLDAICLKAMSKTVEDRFHTMDKFARALTEFVKAEFFKSEKTAVESTGTSTAAPPPPVSRGATLPASQAATSDTQKEFDQVLDHGVTIPVSEEEAPSTKQTTADRATTRDTSEDQGDSTLLSVSEGYRLIDRIGAGEYGEVWRAAAPGGIEVAVKKIMFPVGHRATTVELSALELMKRLRHSFLIQVQAYWVTDEQLVIVMELADRSLEERAAEGAVPRDELLRYMREAAEAIDYLHGEQVLHRDIKPGNILLVKGHVKVADFGIATAGVLGRDELTTASATLGTPLYMAPELWNKQAGPRSDQYSLAVTYLELRQGAEPEFDERKRVIVSSLPAPERAVVEKAVAEEPKNRYDNCASFVQALDDLVRAEQRAIQRRQLNRRRLVIAACLAPLAVPIVAWLIMNPFWITPPDLTILPEAVVTRAGGPAGTLTVAAIGAWGDPPEIVFENKPDGVQLVQQPGDGGVEVTVEASLHAVAQDVEVVVVATAGDKQVRRSVPLTILPAEYYMPPGTKPAPSAMLKAVAGSHYYDRIVRVVPTGTAVEFVLVSKVRGGDPDTFYCLRDKVSNELFREFASEHPDKIKADSDWTPGGSAWQQAEKNPRLPVFNIDVDTAHACAEWLGGRLPTARQWDKAAGRWDHEEGAEGPFHAPIFAAGGDPPAVAVGRSAEGPLPIGAATADISDYGCRDMAGNGVEFTRDIIGIGRGTVPLDQPGNDLLLLRGRSYKDHEPLRYRDLEDELQVESMPYHATAADISFRCVIEVPIE